MTTISKSEKLKKLQKDFETKDNHRAYELCRVFEQVWQVAPDESALAISNKIMSKDIAYFMFVFDLDSETDYDEKLKQATKQSFRSRREWREQMEELQDKGKLESEEEEVKENLLRMFSETSTEIDREIRESLLEIVRTCIC